MITGSQDRDRAETAARALELGAATIGESGGRNLHPRLHAIWPGARLAGPAFTVRCGAGDNLAVHLGVTLAPAGSILVVDAQAVPALGYWGEVLTTAAIARGLAGLVIDGGVRDVAALERRGFPVFATTVALSGALKAAGGSVELPVSAGGVEISPGDWIVGDRDGVTAVARAAWTRVLDAASVRAAREEELFRALSAGASTIDLLGLDPSPVQRP